MSAGHADPGTSDSNADCPPFGEAPVFVAGATGYIGARLVPCLLDAGYSVRCIARAPRKIEPRSWSRHPRVSIVQGDLTSTQDLASLMRGCQAAFYLVHSVLSAGEDDTARDVESARRFVRAASDAGLARIIYLGSLREAVADAKGSLVSRNEVARVLASSDVPVTVLRAAMIIGSGSVSFEVLRYLVERQPVMFPPKWVKTAIQPIAVRNVLRYLVACLAEPRTVGRTLDIGGPAVVTYLDLLRTMAQELGLRPRLIVPLPVAMSNLSALWMGVTTPVSREMVRPLADGLSSPVVCEDHEAASLMPQDLIAPREAIRLALRKIQQSEVESAWSDAGAIPGDPDWAGGRIFRDRREMLIDAPPEAVFQAASKVGGRHGYYVGSLLWSLRGSLDDLAGGPGLQRGRRDARSLRYGDAVDFWRVTAVEPGRVLRLQAEMKVPGDALLEFSMEPLVGTSDGRSGGVAASCRLTQTATFIPRGLPGLAYWYSMLPFHAWIFTGMLRGIKKEAERATRDAAPASRSPA